MQRAITPQPVSPESWVAVLITFARQLTVADHHQAADHVYAAAAAFAGPEVER